MQQVLPCLESTTLTEATARRMQICKLCRREVESLQESHIIPRWAFRRNEHVGQATGLGTMRVHDGRATRIPSQPKAYLLCRDCEQRFSLFEEYTSRVAWQTSRRCPLVEHLQIFCAEDLRGYPQLRVDIPATVNDDALVRFSLSVFWRASLLEHDGRTIELGPYAEPIRAYLAGENHFPEGVTPVLAAIAPPPDGGFETADRTPSTNHHILAYPSSQKTEGCHQHAFLIHGLYFELWVGKTPPERMRVASLTPSRKIVVAAYNALPIFDALTNTLTRARVAGNLRTWPGGPRA